MGDHSHHHDHMCFCACTNPVVTLLKKDLFGPENLALLTAALPKEKPEVVLPAPIVFTGGIIRPMIDGKASTVEAIGFADTRVFATGSLAFVREQMDANFRDQYTIRNLEPNQTLLPGLFEPHIHVIYSGLMASFVDVGPFDGQDIRQGYDKTWVQGKLKANLPSAPGAILLANGLDPALLTPYSPDNFTDIDYTFLDEVSDSVPIMVISASGHTVYINSPAIYEVYKVNEEKIKADGYTTPEDFRKDGKGLLQEEKGLLYAFGTFKPQIMQLAQNMNKNLDAFFAEANSRGVTSMYDAILNEEYLGYLRPYVNSKKLPVRLGGARYCETLDALDDIPDYTAPENYNDIYFGHVKVVADGSNQGLTGYQSENYTYPPKENPAGIFDFDPQSGTYQILIKSLIIGKGWPLMIHANGDKAVTLTIDAYRDALKNHDGDPLRNRIEHCSLLNNRNQLDEMAELGIFPSFLIGHVGYWGFVFKDIIFKGQKLDGSDKVNMLDLCKSALRKNLRISLHSDHTVTPIGPLRMMEQSITRVMEAHPPANDISLVLNEDERLTPEEALRAATFDAAWQCYAEKWAGSLPKGHFADFIILEKDPLSMPMDEISMNMRNIKVEETWLGGEMVYSAI